MAETARRLLGDCPHVMLIDPLDYQEMIQLMLRSDLVITDSGGLQEEAPTLGRPVLVMRDVTERPEAVDAGIARLVGTDREKIVSAACEYLAGRVNTLSKPKPVNCYGDGMAAERIVAGLLGVPMKEWVADLETSNQRVV